MAVPQEILKLAERFESQRAAYESGEAPCEVTPQRTKKGKYNEAQKHQ